MENPEPKEWLAVVALAVTGFFGSLAAFFRFVVPGMRKRNGNGHQAALEGAHAVATLAHLQQLVALQQEQVRELGSLRRILVEHAIQLRGVEAGVEAILQDSELMLRARNRYRLDYRESGA